MISRFCKTTVLSFIVVSLLIPSGLLFYPPKKAEAQEVSCLARIAGALGVSKYFDDKKRVPNSQDYLSKSSVAGNFVEVCIFKPLVAKMAKELLHDMTQKTVNWINSGFKGNPGFALDLSGMLKDVADDVIGDFIAKEAPFLCSQFSFQLKIRLAQSYLPYRQRSACTLSSVINNVNGFIDNNGNVGWDNWIQVTTVPQNNAYGAFEIAQDELSKRIFNAQEKEKTYLNWGRGFKDWEFCESQSEAEARTRTEAGYSDDIDVSSLAKRECRRETPGAIIQERMSATLNIDLQEIGLANDLNAIYDALTNQLANQVIGGATKGLLGGSRGARRNVLRPTDFTAASRPTSLSSTSAVGNALSNGINTGANEFSAQASDVPPTFISTIPGGSTGVTTLGRPVFPQTLSLTIDPTSSTLVDNSNPLVFIASLNSNYLTGGLNFRIALKPTETMVDVPYLNVFSNVTADFTLYNGTTRSVSVLEPEQATLGWADVGTDSGKPFIVKVTAPKNPAIAPGNYTLETVIYDNNGETLDINRHTITVQ